MRPIPLEEQPITPEFIHDATFKELTLYLMLMNTYTKAAATMEDKHNIPHIPPSAPVTIIPAAPLVLIS